MHYEHPSSGGISTIAETDVPDMLLGPVKLTGARYYNQYNSISGATTTDCYTCPAGKRALIMKIHVYNTHDSNSITPIYYWRISSVDYPIYLASSLAAGNGNYTTNNFQPMILEAGEIIRVVTTGNGVLNSYISILEMDDTNSIKTAKASFSAAVSGYYPIYTCPAGKTANIFPIDSLFGYGGGQGTGGQILCITGTSVLITPTLTPSGQVAGAGYRLGSVGVGTAGSRAGILALSVCCNTNEIIGVYLSTTFTGLVSMTVVEHTT